MAVIKFTQIEENSRTPKYAQVVNLIRSDIENGIFKVGDRIPSINETSEDFLLSRDTVEKAYSKLKERGIIKSVPGKGFYVSRRSPDDQLSVLLVINKISTHKKKIVNAFVDKLGERAVVETCVHHYSTDKLQWILDENRGNYDYYAIIPCFKDFSDKTLDVLRSIPKEKLILIDKDVEGLGDGLRVVCENFKADLYDTLRPAMEQLMKYQRMVLIFPDGNQHVPETMIAFKRFCVDHQYDYCITNAFSPEYLKQGNLYIVIEEDDLVDIIKHCKRNQIKIGQEVGIISYNDTPIKEVLHDGITVISTDFKKMGETAAQMVLGECSETKVYNPFYLIHRPSL